MPRVEIPLYRLRKRLREVPYERPDCFLVSILEEGQEVGSRELSPGEYDDEDGVFPIPFVAAQFDPIQAAAARDPDDWSYSFGKKGGMCRLGLGTPSVGNDVVLVFAWDEGTFDKLLHEGRFGYCRYCGRETRGHVSDCLGRRSHALAEALLAGDLDTARTHAEYIRAHHQPRNDV